MSKTASFDIETYCPIEELTEEELEYLKGRRDYASQEEFYRDTAVNPYVSLLVSFSFFFLEEGRAYVFYMGEEDQRETLSEKYGEKPIELVYTSISIRDGLFSAERRLLEMLWEGLRVVDTLLTFHGRDFDMEFVKIRTIIHELYPPEFHRYLHPKGVNHIDLKDTLRAGRNNYSLNFISKRLGLPMDKGDMDGSRIREVFLRGEYRRVAEYNLRDALLTGMIYERVRKYLYHEHVLEMVKSAGFFNAKDLIEYALDRNLISGKETSMLIDLCKGKKELGPTDRQMEFLRSLVKDSEPELRDVCGLLGYDTLYRIVKSTEEEEIT